jgi:hypothetical protein
MTTHRYTLTAAILLLTISTAPVLTSCAGAKQMSPQAEQAAQRLKEAAQSLGAEHVADNACSVYLKQLEELVEGPGNECREVLRKVRAERGGV